MAFIPVENKVCSVCRADIRAGALFCYGCGSAVSEGKPNEISASVDSTVMTDGDDGKTAASVDTEAEKKETAATELKSAAQMRRKSKSFQNKKVEVFWEEHENAPNVWFISVAVFLALVSAVILFLAFRLK